MVKPVIFQIVGYQNSGKTTITQKLIGKLLEQGLKTAAIKHHGHGGRPNAQMQKDSTKHLSAGACASLVEGDGSIILMAERHEFSLEDQIKLMTFFSPDVILIEGHKQKSYPKLLLLRDEKDAALLSRVTNVAGIGFWKEEMAETLTVQKGIPSFYIHGDHLIDWCAEFIRNIPDNK